MPVLPILLFGDVSAAAAGPERLDPRDAPVEVSSKASVAKPVPDASERHGFFKGDVQLFLKEDVASFAASTNVIRVAMPGPDEEVQSRTDDGPLALSGRSRPTQRVSVYHGFGDSNAEDRPRLAVISGTGNIRESFPAVTTLSSNGLFVVPDFAATALLPFPTGTLSLSDGVVNSESPAPAPSTDAYTTRSGAEWEFAPLGFDRAGWRYGVEAHSNLLTVKSSQTPLDFAAGAFDVSASGPTGSPVCTPSGSISAPVYFCNRYTPAAFSVLTSPAASRFAGTSDGPRSGSFDLVDFEYDRVRRKTRKTGVSGAIGRQMEVDTPFGEVLATPEVRVGYDRWDFESNETLLSVMSAELTSSDVQAVWERSGEGDSGRVGAGIDVTGKIPGGLPLSYTLSAEYGVEVIDLDVSLDAYRYGNDVFDFASDPQLAARSRQAVQRKAAATTSYGAIGARMDLELGERIGVYLSVNHRTEAFVTDTWLVSAPSVLAPEVRYLLKQAGATDAALGLTFAF